MIFFFKYFFPLAVQTGSLNNSLLQYLERRKTFSNVHCPLQIDTNKITINFWPGEKMEIIIKFPSLFPLLITLLCNTNKTKYISERILFLALFSRISVCHACARLFCRLRAGAPARRLKATQSRRSFSSRSRSCLWKDPEKN